MPTEPIQDSTRSPSGMTTDHESNRLTNPDSLAKDSQNAGSTQHDQTFILSSDGESELDTSSTQTLVIKPKMLLEQNVPQTTPKAGEEPDYELTGVLGVGGMGIIYDARQTSIDRTVALKMIKGDAAQSGESKTKFLAEAVVTGDLDHPNIVPIYDVGMNSQGQLFYSMKKVQGTPWMHVITKKTLSENLDILMRTADAVGFAHARGVVHRDLKPENVMLGEFGEVLVMDWGLAFPLAAYRKSHSVASAKSMGGTPAYMAPEMVVGPLEKIGPTSDVYLLGAILYEIVTGHPPHVAKPVMKCLEAAARNQIAATDKSGELVDIALKAMSTDPGDRYQTVKELQTAIREYQSHLESVFLSTRADEDLKEALSTDNYQKFSRALFGFQEAFGLWNGNKRAETGISAAKQAYAESAKRKGDFDLGLSLLEESDTEHAGLRRELIIAQDERLSRQKRLDFLKRAALGLAIAVMVILLGASVWIRSAQLDALAQKEVAVKAQGEAVKEKENAIQAAKDAREAEREANAQKQKADLERDRADDATLNANNKRQEAEDAKDEAIKAKELEEYESYISKIGLAASQIDKNAFDVARVVLNSCKPKDSSTDRDLRNWEWGRLEYLCSQFSRDFKCPSEIVAPPWEAVAISQDGTQLAAGGWSGLAVVWKRETGEVLATLKHDREYVNSVAFSPNGKFLATGGNSPNGRIQIWDIATGQKIRSINGHTDDVLSVVYSKDGKKLLSSSYDNTACLWNAESGKLIQEFKGHTWWVWWAVFSADEKRIITASHDGTVIVWKIGSNDHSNPFTGHQGPVFCAALSPDGKHAVSAGYDRMILAWKPDEVPPFDFKKLDQETVTSSVKTRVFEGHTDGIRSIQFSDAGELVLTASSDNTVRVWAFDTNQPLKTFRGHGGQVKAAVFGPGGESILSASQDTTVREWKIGNYEEIRTLRGPTLEGHTDAVLSAAYSRDQTKIVTSSRDKTARIWDAKTGKPGQILDEGHSFLASNVTFFPGGRLLLTAAVDNTARIWNVSNGGEVRRMDHCGRSAAAAISHDANWIATGGDDKSAQIWNAKTGVHSKKFAGHTFEVTSVAFSPDDRILASGDAKGHIKLWNVEEGSSLMNLVGHTRRISALMFLHDGSRLLSASSDKTIGQWDTATGRERSELILKHPESVLAMKSIPGRNLIVSSCADSKIRIWDADTATIVLELGPFVLEVKSADPNEKTKIIHADIYSLDISPDGKRLLAAFSQQRTVRMWDLSSGREITVPKGQGKVGPIVDLNQHGGLLWSTAFVPGTEDVLTAGGSDVRIWDGRGGRSKMTFKQHQAVASAHFSPNGDLIVTSSWDYSAKIWDAATGRVIRKLENGHTGFVNTAYFSPDGNLVVTASDDGTAKLWNVESGSVVATFDEHEDRVRSAIFSPNGKFLVTTSNDKSARLWNIDSKAMLRKFEGHEWAVVCADISQDGNLLVTGSEDNKAFVWDIETGKRMLTLDSHTAPVTSVAFSPDMSRIVTGSRDLTAKLWDAQKEKEILTLSRHTEEVTSVSFSPDGRQVLTGSRDGTAVIWLSTDWHHSEQSP